MGFVKQWITSLFFLVSSAACTEEIFQGTLKNGIRYYLFSGWDTQIDVVVKTPQQYYNFPFGSDPFFSDENFLTPPFKGMVMQGPKYWRIGITVQRPVHDCLAYLSERLKADAFPKEVIAKLIANYIEEKEYENPRLQEGALENFLVGYEPGYVDSIFSEGAEAVHKIYHAFFEPCRMSLIITGLFDPQDVEQELESLFGDISGDGIFIDSAKFIPERPLAITVKYDDEELLEDDDDEKRAPENIYYYQLEPTFKNQVLSDLFLNIGKMEEDFSVGKLECDPSFTFQEQIPTAYIDRLTFNRLKGELEEAYRSDDTDIRERCIRHFLSKITDKLEIWNQNFLRELENIEQEDLNLFIEQHIKNIPISREFVL